MEVCRRQSGEKKLPDNASERDHHQDNDGDGSQARNGEPVDCFGVDRQAAETPDEVRWKDLIAPRPNHLAHCVGSANPPPSVVGGAPLGTQKDFSEGARATPPRLFSFPSISAVPAACAAEDAARQGRNDACDPDHAHLRALNDGLKAAHEHDREHEGFQHHVEGRQQKVHRADANDTEAGIGGLPQKKIVDHLLLHEVHLDRLALARWPRRPF
mmetsp:Transcript_43146/g.94036  ORF Transcript_43146/g.94036 Transcript_43146/m.94036 type:complete len:214 (+) Transcript_43146:1089-1730(+)